MKRFLTSALSAAALALIMPVAAHATPQGSSSLFLSKLEEYLLDEGMPLHYKVVVKDPNLTLERGQMYCDAKASGVSTEEFVDINLRSIVKVADNRSDVSFLIELFSAIDAAAGLYLCPELEEQIPSYKGRYIGS